MGRKKKRNNKSKTEKTVASQPRKAGAHKSAAFAGPGAEADKAQSAAPRSIAPQAIAKKPSQLATYLLCGIKFTAGVLAQKTYDRWKTRQDLALRKHKQTAEQGRVTELRPNSKL